MFGAKISNVVKKYVRVDVQKAKITCRGVDNEQNVENKSQVHSKFN